MIDYFFNFNSVGQGCFYTARVSIGDQENQMFDFVYDCGSNSKRRHINKSISDYKNFLKETNKGYIDLLVISHFHKDHVDGVVDLLEGICVKKLIIPYYKPIERLLLCTVAESDDENYQSMLQNPIDYFSSNEFDIEEIILIGGRGNEDLGSDEIPVEPFDDIEKLNRAEDISTLLYSIEGDEAKEDLIEAINELEELQIDTSKLQFLKKPYQIVNKYWEFVFYLKEHDNQGIIDNFTAIINNYLSEHEIELKNLFEQEHVNEIKRLYQNTFKNNINVTSLATYHGPLNHLNRVARNTRVYQIINIINHFCYPKTGTLLTGDIDISKEEGYNSVKKYFEKYIVNICIFQMPHHGSHRNWYFEPENAFNNCNFYIINSGIGRKKHPSVKVIEYIKDYCSGRIVLNNEAVEFNTHVIAI